MVTNYPRQLVAAASASEGQPARALTVLATRVKQTLCGLSGHDAVLHFEEAGHDALHVVRPPHAGPGGQRTRPAAAVRRGSGAAPDGRRTAPRASQDCLSRRVNAARRRPVNQHQSAARAARTSRQAITSAMVDVFFAAVKTCPARPEQHRWRAGCPEHGSIRPEAHADVRWLNPARTCGAAERGRQRVVLANLVGRPREGGARGRLEQSRPPPAGRRGSGRPLRGPPTGLAGQRAAFQLETAAVRIAAQLPAACDDRRMQRRRAEAGMRRARLQLTVERLEPPSTRPIREDGVPPVRRPAAVRGAAARFDLEPGEALVRDADLQVGRLGHDGAVRAPAATSASAPRLAYSSSTTTATISRPAESRRCATSARRIDHRRDAALHVLDAAAVQPAVRPRAGRTAPPCPRRRPYRCGRRTSASGRAHRPSSTPMTLGRPGADLLHVHVEADAGACAPQPPPRPHASPRCARHQRRVHGIDGDERSEKGEGGIHRQSGRSRNRQSAVGGRQSVERSRSSAAAGLRRPIVPDHPTLPVADCISCRNDTRGPRGGHHRRLVRHRAGLRGRAGAGRGGGGARRAARGPARGGGDAHPSGGGPGRRR